MDRNIQVPFSFGTINLRLDVTGEVVENSEDGHSCLVDNVFSASLKRLVEAKVVQLYSHTCLELDECPEKTTEPLSAQLTLLDHEVTFEVSVTTTRDIDDQVAGMLLLEALLPSLLEDITGRITNRLCTARERETGQTVGGSKGTASSVLGVLDGLGLSSIFGGAPTPN